MKGLDATNEKPNIEAEKEAAIQRIKEGMHNPDFRLSPADTALLKQDFVEKLRFWKAFLEDSRVREKLGDFIMQNRNQEITPEFFEEFIKKLQNEPDIWARYSGEGYDSSKLPLEIINPNSGWFAVLIINKKTKFEEFRTAIHGNMNSWFEL